MRVCISSGHSTRCRGAVGLIDEVDEATRVANSVYEGLKRYGVDVHVFHDTVSNNQQDNLETIVDWHNSMRSDLDLSIHFNAFEPTAEGRGVEVLYVTQEDLAAAMSYSISNISGLKNRGAKYRDDLYVLNSTNAPCVLAEICFVDSEKDVELYRAWYDLIVDEIVDAVVEHIGLDPGTDEETPPPVEIEDATLFHAIGRCSHFGGPADLGVSSSEGLAFHFDLNEDNQHLFLPFQPSGTTGLARRLNAKAVHYVACRWNYDVTPKEVLAGDTKALVTSRSSGASAYAFCADWGPHGDTDRVADLSPALMESLGLDTDDEVEVIYPAPED